MRGNHISEVIPTTCISEIILGFTLWKEVVKEKFNTLVGMEIEFSILKDEKCDTYFNYYLLVLGMPRGTTRRLWVWSDNWLSIYTADVAISVVISDCQYIKHNTNPKL